MLVALFIPNQNMLDSVIRIMFKEVLHVNHKLRLGFTNTEIRLPHGLGSAAFLSLACGLCGVPVFRSETHCCLAEPKVVTRQKGYHLFYVYISLKKFV